VTVTLNGPAGDVVGPVPLELVDPNSSLYAATIAVPGPGSWAVTANSTSPEGSVETEVDVVEQAADTTTPSTTPPSTTVAPGDADAAGDGEPDDGTTDGVTTSGSEGADSGDNRWLLVTAAVAAVAIVVVVTLVLRRREGAGDPDVLEEPEDPS
jgi:hypothetical protein